MDEGVTAEINEVNDNKSREVIYSSEKDFYKGLGGELRLKAEGLFKKAKEKGISIEEISITTLKENCEDFPGIGKVELPTFVVQVKGKHMASGQVIVDAKQIDYFNRYKKYLAEKIEDKNAIKDERGKKIREFGRIKTKEEIEFYISDWERFLVVKSLLEDKEFGLEKTITGACDRVIRKLMGENDWLYPEEARLLDEEFSSIQNRVTKEQDERKITAPPIKKATDRQINYMKAKLKNLGVDPDNTEVMQEVLRQSGFDTREINDLSTSDMSKIIDNITSIAARVKESVSGQGYFGTYSEGSFAEGHEGVKQ